VHTFIILSRPHQTGGRTNRWRTFDAREILRTLTSEVVAVCPTLTFNLTSPQITRQALGPDIRQEQTTATGRFRVKGECVVSRSADTKWLVATVDRTGAIPIIFTKLLILVHLGQYLLFCRL